MNFQQLRDAARERLGVTGDDPMASNSTVGSIVNTAMHAFESEYRAWPFLRREYDKTLVVGQESYPLVDTPPFDPVGFEVAQIEDIYIVGLGNAETRMPLVRRQRGQQLAEYPFTTQAPPETWSVDAGAVHILPVPNLALTIHVIAYAAIPDMYLDDDVPRFIPERFHGAIVEKASEILHRRFHNSSEAATSLAEYNQWVIRARRNARQYAGAGSMRNSPDNAWG